MRQMRQRKTVWVLGALVLLALGALWWWASQRPPSIVIPPRQYPPNNAYDAYKQIAQGMHDQWKQDDRLRRIESQLFSKHSIHLTVPEADKQYYLQRRRPFLEAYRQYLDQPCKAVFEYDILWLMPELAGFRTIARIEALLIGDALAAGREAEAIQRFHDLMRFSEQIRTDGTLTHYLVGSRMIETGLQPIRQRLTQFQSPKVFSALVELAQKYDQSRAPLKDAIQNEYYCGLGTYRDIALRRIEMRDIEPLMSEINFSNNFERWLYESGFGLRLTWGRSLAELQEYYKRVFTELEKPLWERKVPAPNFKQRTNEILGQVWMLHVDLSANAELREVATIRLLGCYAAIKRYYQQRGAYPPSLEALRPQLGVLIIDPFTGKPFVYRTDPKRGFQLYSVGENLTDDGGRLSANRQQGDLLPITEGALPEGQRPSPTRLSSPPVWLR